MEKRSEQGQVAILVTLMMVVMGVVVGSVVTRTVTDLRVVSLEESSNKALRSAEAGVEVALNDIDTYLQQGTTQRSDGADGINYSVSAVRTGSNVLVSDVDIEQGDVVQLDLSLSTSRPPSINIFWGDSSDSSETSPYAAVEVIKYRVNGGNYTTTRYAYDPVATRRDANSFDSPANGSAVNGVTYGYRATVPIDTNDRYVRIRPYYNQTKIAISPTSGNLGPQVTQVTSSGSTVDGVSRRVQATKSESYVPGIFDAVLYSGTTLVHN